MLRYFLRSFKFLSAIILSGNIIIDQLFGKRMFSEAQKKQYNILMAICGVLVLVCGLANGILMKKELGKNRGQGWMMFIHLKLWLTVILFTPLIDVLTKNNEFLAGLKGPAQLITLVFFIFLSPALKAHREGILKSMKEKQNETRYQPVRAEVEEEMKAMEMELQEPGARQDINSDTSSA